MSKSIYGVTVGTPYNPQKVVDKTLEQAKEYVDNEISKIELVKIVEVLPDVGSTKFIYLVPKQDAQSQDMFDEYVWTEKKGWEWITAKQIDIDLTDYIKKTDYATDKTFGVVKVANGNYGIGHNEPAGLYIAQASEYHIKGKTDNYRPITSKVLDYAVKVGVTTNTNELTAEEKTTACEWLGAVKPTDYATKDKAGLVTVSVGNGLSVNNIGLLSIVPANQTQIDSKQARYVPIVPYNLDYALKVGLTTNTETLTDEEKATVCEWLGATTQQYVDKGLASAKDNLLLKDSVSGKIYKIYVADGKLTMEVSE
jgi:hypothetical protein